MAQQKQMKKDATVIFESASIPKVVVKNCVPSLIAMSMVLIYNLADTFFIGLTHNDLQVAAASLGTPVFLIFIALGTLFGVGGSSVISRALGAGNREYAKKACSFCMWGCIAVGGFVMAILWIFMDKIVVILGTSEHTLQYTKSYLGIIVGSGIFTMTSNCFSNVIRAEGKPVKAMTGMVIGNLLNIVLDPIMILALDWGITGAAIATVIGNGVAFFYYLLHFLCKKSSLSIHIKDFSMKDGILTGVLSIGLSTSLDNFLVNLSAIVINGQLAKSGDMYVAGYGVASKVILIVILMGIGMGNGVQPFFGYCYGAKKRERLIGGIRFSVFFGGAICCTLAALGVLFAEPIVKAFLTNEKALNYGVEFTRLLMSTAWTMGMFAVCQAMLQAMGAATSALVAVLFRHGVLVIPMALILGSLMGERGYVLAQPIADLFSLGLILVMMIVKFKKIDFKKQLSAT